MPFPPGKIQIGVYMQPANKLAAWAARGATFVVTDGPKPDDNGPTREEYFAAGHAAGTGVMMGVKDADVLRKDIARPGHVGVYLPDEPDHWAHLIGHATNAWDVPASIAEWKANVAALRAVDAGLTTLAVFTGSQVYWAGTVRDLAARKVIIQDDYRQWSQGATWTGADWYLLADGVDPGKIVERQGRVIDRLLAWSKTGNVFAFVECAPVLGDKGRAPTPEEMRAEAWTGLIHGAKGLLYFPLKVRNGFVFDAVPPDLVPHLTELNAQVQGYADFLLNGDRVRTGEQAVWTLPNGATLTAEVVWNTSAQRWDTWVKSTAATGPTPDTELTRLRDENANLTRQLAESQRLLVASREVAEQRHEEVVMIRNRVDRIRAITNEP